MSNLLLTKKRLANYLGISVSTIDNMRATGEIPSHDYEITKRAIKLWHPDTISRWLETMRVSSQPQCKPSSI